MNILLIVSISLLVSFQTDQTSPPRQDPGLYCHDDFHFCARYPSAYLPNQSYLPSHNGIQLKTEDERGVVTIGGYPEKGDKNPREIFESRLIQLEQTALPDEKSTVVSSIFGEDFYECFFLIGRNYYYHQSFLFEGYYVLVEIKTPINRPDLMTTLHQQISLDFQNVQPPSEVGLLVPFSEKIQRVNP